MAARRAAAGAVSGIGGAAGTVVARARDRGPVVVSAGASVPVEVSPWAVAVCAGLLVGRDLRVSPGWCVVRRSVAVHLSRGLDGGLPRPVRSRGVWLGPVRSGGVWLGPVWTGRVWLGSARSGGVWLGSARSGGVWLGPVWTRRVWLGPVRARRVRLGPLRTWSRRFTGSTRRDPARPCVVLGVVAIHH